MDFRWRFSHLTNPKIFDPVHVLIQSFPEAPNEAAKIVRRVQVETAMGNGHGKRPWSGIRKSPSRHVYSWENSPTQWSFYGEIMEIDDCFNDCLWLFQSNQ